MLITLRLCCCFCVPLLCFLNCSKKQRSVYYISNAGNDSNSGLSQEDPWQSLGRINDEVFTAGSIIRLKGGDAFRGTIVLDSADQTNEQHPITITSYGAGRASIQAGKNDGITVRDLGNVIIKNLDVIGESQSKNESSGIHFINTLSGNKKLKNVTIDSVDASGFGNCGINVEGKANDNSQSGYERVSITHVEAYENVMYGILVTGPWDNKTSDYANAHVSISHCKAFANSGDSTYMENHSGSGILMDNVDTGAIEHCIAFNNGYLCNATVGGPVGIWMHSVNKGIIQFCVAINNRTGKGLDGGGFDFDAGVTHSILQYNYSSNNDGAGYLIYNYPHAPHRFHHNTIRYNVSENDGRKNSYAGIWVRNDGDGVHDLQIYNNTIFASPHKAGNPSALYVANTSDVLIFNNNILTRGVVPLVCTSANQNGLVLTNNNYWSYTDDFLFYMDVEGYTPQTGKKITSIADWQKQTGHHSGTTRSDDPMIEKTNANTVINDISTFHNLTSYRLTANSKLIDAGIVMPPFGFVDAIHQDMLNTAVPAGKGVDIGAYEFVNR